MLRVLEELKLRFTLFEEDFGKIGTLHRTTKHFQAKSNILRSLKKFQKEISKLSKNNVKTIHTKDNFLMKIRSIYIL
jgi:hypothetical protein